MPLHVRPWARPWRSACWRSWADPGGAFITLLRLVHIFLGVFWAGTAFYLLLFLTPSIVAAGPSGGRVMQELVKRGQLTFFPVIGTLAGQAQATPEGPERDVLMGQAMASSARAARAGKWVAWLLAVTVVCMALSRTI